MLPNIKESGVSKRNRVSWVIVVGITLVSILMIFFGPETYSEVGEAPDFSIKAIDTFLVFLICGALILSTSGAGKLIIANRLIVVLGGVAILLKLLRGIASLRDAHGEGVLVGWAVIGLLIIGLLFVLFKIKNFLKN